jgi:hypothetical protein
MARRAGASVKQLTDTDLVARVQSILINAAEGRRNVGDDSQYNNLRKELKRRPFSTPALVSTHPTVDSFVAYIRGVGDKPERVARIRAEFDPVFRSLETPDGPAVDASAWGAPPSEASRLRTVRSLLPLAQAAVESMITTLSEPNSNNAPILEERAEAIEHLRNLHRTLGELLSALDAGQFREGPAQRLLSEAAGYAKRAARSLRDDPMPYLASALLLGIFEACDLPGIAGYLVGITQNIKKHSGKADE